MLAAIYIASPRAKDAAGSTAAVSAFAPIFAGLAGGMKLSELMLFFGRYMGGAYGDGYIAFDPVQIGRAYRHEFLPRRQTEISAMVMEEERLRRQAQPLINPAAAVPVCVYFTAKCDEAMRRDIQAEFRLDPMNVGGESQGYVSREQYARLKKGEADGYIRLRNKTLFSHDGTNEDRHADPPAPDEASRDSHPHQLHQTERTGHRAPHEPAAQEI